MKDWEADRLRDAEHTLDQAHELGLWRAYGIRHGIEVVVPAAKTREVTVVDKERIRAERAGVSELVWLHVTRDALCVELDLTPDQLAGVLAEATRVKNGGAKSAVPVAVTSPRWPETRPAKNGADPSRRPADGMVEYPAEPADKAAVIAKRKEILLEDTAKWEDFTEVYGKLRRLTRQQIAGIIAVARRTHQLD